MVRPTKGWSAPQNKKKTNPIWMSTKSSYKKPRSFHVIGSYILAHLVYDTCNIQRSIRPLCIVYVTNNPKLAHSFRVNRVLWITKYTNNENIIYFTSHENYKTMPSNVDCLLLNCGYDFDDDFQSFRSTVTSLNPFQIICNKCIAHTVRMTHRTLIEAHQTTVTRHSPIQQ